MTKEEATALSKAELVEIINRLEQKVAELEAELAKARKNSSTSSKPPSSDIVKPPKSPPQKGRRKRKRGGQPGHPRHERPAFAPDEVDKIVEHRPKWCPKCEHQRLEPCDVEPRVFQQIDILDLPTWIEEHRAHGGWCARCDRLYYASIPAEIKNAGLIGPRLSALVGYLKGRCHASYSTIQDFLREVVGVDVSRGQLAKIVGKVANSLDHAYTELREDVRNQAQLNVDETGHKDTGKRYWTWCFRAVLYTLFKIDPSRGSDVLLDVLGEEFNGIMGCDYFSAYRKYKKDVGAAVQFCLAHLIRDVKFLTTLPDRATRNYGNRLLEGLRGLFRVIHRYDRMTERRFRAALVKERDRMLKIGRRAPPRVEAQNLAERFRRHGDAYFRFITTPGVEPTNNLAEQAIRFVVIDRRVTQGTRSQVGRRWCERIWSTIATCKQQDRSLFQFLYHAVHSYLTGTTPPSLLTSKP